ncbi:GntR family transcriptional regulator [Novosphingobium flavum]|uniref:GntR family transcriptional regulator n=1 Tax=Novosphingobium flavum TaxID=1778672 RepID=A0A7X1FTI1_9SPHN|nr:GntR family transcriptional regulator [Novosphingobium flavum]MBC2666700.1 GntR family transcriptional regulator [Novosphingobium flavum]
MKGSLENTLKEMILREELRPGERITEAALADRLGVSRTPVRNVLPRLAAEGFLQPVGKRGFVVADFGEREIYDALDLRSVLEGWAARSLAEEGASPEILQQLEDCLAWGDRLFEKHHLDLDDEREYGMMNERFHQLVIDACNSTLLRSFIDRLNNVPFVAPSVIVFDQVGLRAAFNMLHRAHGFHHAIVDAIRKRDGNRAEFLFREHADHQRVSMFERRRANQGDQPPAATRSKPKRQRKPKAAEPQA